MSVLLSCEASQPLVHHFALPFPDLSTFIPKTHRARDRVQGIVTSNRPRIDPHVLVRQELHVIKEAEEKVP